MTRRCRPGQRCRIIGEGRNIGCVVLVVRAYHGEVVSNATWPVPIFPWIVASLGGPLRSVCLVTNREAAPKMVIVVDDCELEPLDDDDAGIADQVVLGKPKRATGTQSGQAEARHRDTIWASRSAPPGHNLGKRPAQALLVW